MSVTFLISTFVLLSIVSNSIAHNWINSISRSVSASTTRPVVPSSTNKPHATVAPNQKFQVEYMTGHGDFTYFFVLSANDRANLGLIDKQLIKEVLASAPAGQDVPLRDQYRKFHRKLANDLHTFEGKQNFYKSIVANTSSDYIRREVVFEGKLSGRGTRNKAIFDESDVGTIVQVEYKDEHTVNDRRLTWYDSPHPKFPWLLEFRQYALVCGSPGEMDVVNFELPAGVNMGDYYVHYNYNGYYDVVDVRLQPQPAKTIYGAPPPPEKKYVKADYVRIDHCAFDVDQTVGACVVMTTNFDSCKLMCEKVFYSQCTGIMIVPVFPPKGQAFQNVSLVPWDIGDQENKCPKKLLEEAKPGDFLCVPVRANLPTETKQNIIVTRDPLAPEFYSTCWVRQKPLGPDDAPVDPPPRQRHWRYEQQCTSCKHAAAAQRHEQLWVDWDLNKPDVCVNCDLEPVDPMSLPPVKNWTAVNPYRKIEPDTRCKENFNGVMYKQCGFGGDCLSRFDQYCGLRCHRDVYLHMGKGDLSEQDCAVAVRRQPDCDPDRVYRHVRQDGAQNRCGCWAKGRADKPGCCPPCEKITGMDFGRRTMYELDPAFVEPTGPLGGNDAVV